MAELGRAALIVTLGLALYALVAGGAAAALGRRRLALSARNALVAAFFSTVVATAVLVAGFVRNDFSLAYVADHSSRELPLPYKISAFWGGQEGSLLLWLLVLTGYSALAIWIAGKRARDLVVWVTPVLGGIAVGFTWLLVAVSSPFDTIAGAGGRQRAQSEPPEPVHGRASRVPLPGLRRAGGAVRVRDGGAALRPHGRALDRRNAPLDDRRVDGARDRAAARRPLGLPGGRLGRLLRVGPGRERRADALARGDRVPPLGDDPGEARDAPRLERHARQPCVLPLALRDLPHALRRRQLDPLVHAERDRAVVPRVHRDRRRLLRDDDLAAAAPAPDERAARVARLARGGVPLQQPAPRRPLPDDPLGHGLADPLGGRPGGGGRRRTALLRLLPAHLRAPAPPADGHRAARRVAARVAARARSGVHVARRDRAGDRRAC